MSDGEKVTVRFSEVHWYEITLPWADVEAAYGQDIGGCAGLVDEDGDIPDALNDLLDGAMGEAGETKACTEVDGREIHSVRRVGEPQ